MVVRKDLNMSPGKCAAQCCHASLMAFLSTQTADLKAAKSWFDEGQTKIIVQVENEAELLELYKQIKSDKKLEKCHYLVRDAGHTELKGQNLTVLGIGPISSEHVDKYTRKLRLYK
jgi:PTH2 family peptidyl-tRNA hydrolase